LFAQQFGFRPSWRPHELQVPFPPASTALYRGQRTSVCPRFPEITTIRHRDNFVFAKIGLGRAVGDKMQARNVLEASSNHRGGGRRSICPTRPEGLPPRAGRRAQPDRGMGAGTAATLKAARAQSAAMGHLLTISPNGCACLVAAEHGPRGKPGSSIGWRPACARRTIRFPDHYTGPAPAGVDAHRYRRCDADGGPPRMAAMLRP
jgi:hypothetical protein